MIYLASTWGGRDIGTPVRLIGSEGDAPAECIEVDAARLQALLDSGLASDAPPDERPRKPKKERA